MDNDQLYVNTEVAQGTGFPLNSALTQRVARILETDPDIENSSRLRGIAILAADRRMDACS